MIVGHTDAQHPDSEDRASELANEINRFIHEVRGWKKSDDVSNKVVSLLRDDWRVFSSEARSLGCSAIWFGLELRRPEVAVQPSLVTTKLGQHHVCGGNTRTTDTPTVRVGF